MRLTPPPHTHTFSPSSHPQRLIPNTPFFLPFWLLLPPSLCPFLLPPSPLCLYSCCVSYVTGEGSSSWQFSCMAAVSQASSPSVQSSLLALRGPCWFCVLHILARLHALLPHMSLTLVCTGWHNAHVHWLYLHVNITFCLVACIMHLCVRHHILTQS